MLQKFEFRSTLIPGLIEIIPFKADDSRGAFIKIIPKKFSRKMEYLMTYRKFFIL